MRFYNQPHALPYSATLVKAPKNDPTLKESGEVKRKVILRARLCMLCNPRWGKGTRGGSG
jgi:hypothetical protein